MRRLAAFVLAGVITFSLIPGTGFAVEPYNTSDNNLLTEVTQDPNSQTVTDSVFENETLTEANKTIVDMHADAGRTVSVAFPFAKGISETDENGIHSGAFYDWLIEISKYTGWNYEFVTGDIDGGIDAVLSGDCDLMGAMLYREQYANSVIYPDYTMGSNYSVLLYKPDSGDIKGFDLNTLNGKTIGVYAKATEKIARLKNFLDFNNLDSTIRSYENLEEYRNCLENNDADLLFGNDTDMSDSYEIAARFKSEPHYIVTAIDEPDLAAELNEAMVNIYESNPNFSDELYAKYFPETNATSIVFTDEDRAFVEAADPVRVSLTANRYPIYYQRDDAYRGIAKGVFDLISSRTGLEFEYVQSDTYQDALDAVLSGEVDVMGAFMDDEYFANDMDLALTERYTTLDEVVLRNRSSEYPSDGLVFALPEGRTKTDVVKASQIVYYPTYEACLEAVNLGKADITSMPSSFAEGLYVNHFYANVTPVAVDHIEVVLSIAFAQPVDSRLYSVMNKAVNSFTDEEMETVLSRNVVSATNRQISMESLLYDNPIATLAVGMTFLLLAVGVILLIARSKIRNRILQLKLEKAEETGRAKSDFLSRMSHEIRTPMNAIIGLSAIASQSKDATPGIKTSLTKINTSAQFLLALVNDILDMSKIENEKMKLECAPFSVEALADQMQSMVGIQAEEKGLMMITECDAEEGCVVGDQIRIQQVLANLLSNAFKFTDPGGAVLLSVKEVARREGVARLRFGVKDTGIGIAPDDLERVFESFEQAAENRTNVQGTGLGLAISANLVRMMGGTLKVESSLGEGSEFYFSINLPVSDECETCEDAKAIELISLQGCRLLLAEDNDLNAEIAIALLEMEGIEVSRAMDGQQVVDLFAQSEPGSVDFILMDVKMPIKDGLTASIEIRNLERIDAMTVPIIAITANTFQEDRDSAKAAGMNDFVPKPFDAEQLYSVLRAHKIRPESADSGRTEHS